MTEPIKKRKAQEQLSPYSQDLVNEDGSGEAEHDTNAKPLRRARIKKNQPLDKSSLKGIFGNVVLSGEPKDSRKAQMSEMIAGLNSSFLRAVQIILKKQSNKDLRYLFDQYCKFMKDIEENNQ